MREASYTDAVGRRWAVLLPDDLPDSDARLGFPLGPPALGRLGLPEDLEVRLHNELFARRIFTEADVRRTSDIIAALQAAYKVEAMTILELLRPKEDAVS